MCILFAYSGEDNGGDYKLIIATNRDESFDRPAKPADFWDEDMTIIGGQDIKEGYEGGTWLALSTQTQRVGVLLNLTGHPKKNAKGRGKIVTNYVKSDLTTEEYVKQLRPERKLYNDFNLVTFEIGTNKSKVHCYSNTNNNLATVHDNYLGCSNSLLGTPYKKAEAGKERLRQICTRWAKRETENELVENLFQLLDWKEKHLPDDELFRRAPNWYDSLGSVFVHLPEENYGTRAQTIIMVRKDGGVEFIERSMLQPIDSFRPVWQIRRHSFSLSGL